jgi:hypothetical protein
MAFDSYERRLGPDHLGTLNARRTLSVALAAVGRYADAIADIEAVIEQRTVVLGPDHPYNVADRELLNEYREAQSKA